MFEQTKMDVTLAAKVRLVEAEEEVRSSELCES